MFNKKLKNDLAVSQFKNEEIQGLIDSIKHSVATIQFDTHGVIEDANDIFLSVVGYEKNELVGQSHKIFCDADYIKSPEYKAFWDELRQGKKKSGTFKRFTKSKNVIWLEATYFPIINKDNKVISIFKIASDVTNSVNKVRDLEAAFNALNRSMAIIEFSIDGQILNANANFLAAVGYSINEIIGKPHRMLCFDKFYEENPNFWSEMSSGRFFSGQYERKNASGQSIWLEASYNPVFDDQGKVIKVIKFASDITNKIEMNDKLYELLKCHFQLLKKPHKSLGMVLNYLVHQCKCQIRSCSMLQRHLPISNN